MLHISKVFKTLSDETRLRILNLILERECCVCEVMQALEISQSKASRGLSDLRKVGFLRMRKSGLWTLYSIDTSGNKICQSLLTQAVKEFMKDNIIAVLDKKRLERSERTGTGCARRLRQSTSYRKASP
ncbi:MAG: winged helix-turn-helix transcriptional regulator [Dehalococcoidales bacterium]|nr:winged helix-turn-helix transcriptional regulator [Dehalococcoidales bacterium]